jgi:hypothetical protein
MAITLISQSYALRTISDVKRDVLKSIKLQQNKVNRKTVETLITELGELSKKSPKEYLKPVMPGSYRTLWTTVSADNLLGQLLQQTPDSIANGMSWQIINKDLTIAENIVYWDVINIRMVGKASISAFTDTRKGVTGYDLSIKGLEFRYGEEIPESNFNTYNPDKITKRLKVLELKSDQVLSNGVGKLEFIYNDGLLRISRDEKQNLTYIHVKEPLLENMKKM